MKTLQRNLIVGIGACIGTFVPALLHAQSSDPAPAYVVLEFTIKDPEGFKEYAQQAPATVAQYGGEFLVRPGEIVSLAGEAPEGPFAVIAFDSLEQAQEWASSAEYTALVPQRDETADVRAFIAEGVAPQ